MAKEYTKEFLINAYMFRFAEAGLDTLELERNAEKFYDGAGKKKFREYASLDAAEVARYAQHLQAYGE